MTKKNQRGASNLKKVDQNGRVPHSSGKEILMLRTPSLPQAERRVVPLSSGFTGGRLEIKTLVQKHANSNFAPEFVENLHSFNRAICPSKRSKDVNVRVCQEAVIASIVYESPLKKAYIKLLQYGVTKETIRCLKEATDFLLKDDPASKMQPVIDWLKSVWDALEGLSV